MTIEAIRPDVLSGETFFKMSERSPSEAPPEKGRKSASGVTSLGIPAFLHKGDIKLKIISKKPEERSMDVITRIARIAGKIPTTVLSPFAAPSIKAE